MVNRNKWTEMYQRFENMYSMTANNAIDWYPSGRNQLTVVMSDGSRVIYDDIIGAIRTLTKRGEMDMLDESTWRRCFSIRLQTLMYERHLTQKRLSELTGLNTSSISHYLNEKSVPSAYALRLMADALQCSISDLTDFADR